MGGWLISHQSPIFFKTHQLRQAHLFFDEVVGLVGSLTLFAFLGGREERLGERHFDISLREMPATPSVPVSQLDKLKFHEARLTLWEVFPSTY